MRFAYTILLWVFSVYFIYGFPSFASAQEGVLLEAPKPLGDVRNLRREPDIETFKPVAERTPLHFEPVPIHWRGFQIFPLLTTAQTVDTNIYATSKNEEVDTITSFKPTVAISKDYGRHQASFVLKSEAKKYWSNADEDVFNYSAKMAGFLEARSELKIPFELSYISGHEGRGQNFSPNFSKKPIAYNSYGTGLGLSYDPNRLSVSAIARYADLSFENGETRNGRTLIRTDGDRSLTSLELSSSYEILPNHRPFVSMSFGKTDYKNPTRGTTIERDSTNFDALVGWELAHKGLYEGFVGIGYGSRDYDNDAIEDIDSSRISSNINWNITKKATLNLRLNRSITEDNQIVQGIVLTQGHVQADFEVLNDLYYKAYLGYSSADFQSITREDDVFTAGTGFRYLLNPRWSINGDYSYKSRDSSALGLDYDRHQFMLRLNTRL